MVISTTTKKEGSDLRHDRRQEDRLVQLMGWEVHSPRSSVPFLWHLMRTVVDGGTCTEGRPCGEPGSMPVLCICVISSYKTSMIQP